MVVLQVLEIEKCVVVDNLVSELALSFGKGCAFENETTLLKFFQPGCEIAIVRFSDHADKVFARQSFSVRCQRSDYFFVWLRELE